MLLPVTSSLVWWAFRPEMAENMERSTGGPFGRWEGDGGRLRRRERDLGEAPVGHLLAADHGDRLGVAEADRADRAALRDAVVVGVADGVADQGAGRQGLLQGHQRGVLGGQLLEL